MTRALRRLAVIAVTFAGAVAAASAQPPPPKTDPVPAIPAGALESLPNPNALSERIGQKAPTPAELGLTWLKGEPLEAWPPGKLLVIAFDPPSPLLANYGGFRQRPETVLRTLATSLGDRALVVEVVFDQERPFTWSVDSSMINWRVARMKSTGIDRLLDAPNKWQTNIVIVDTGGHIAWQGGLRATDLAFIVDEIRRRRFDAAAHLQKRVRAGTLLDEAIKATNDKDAPKAEALFDTIERDFPYTAPTIAARRVALLVRLDRLSDAADLAERLIKGICAGDYVSLLELDRHMFAAGVETVRRGGDSSRYKSLRMLAMDAAADALDQTDAQTNADAAERHFEARDYAGAVSRQSAALSFSVDHRRSEYQKTLDRYIAALEGRTPAADPSPMFPSRSK